MVAVNGYFDGQNYVAESAVAVKPNQRVIITLLDEEFAEAKPQNDVQQRLEKMRGFFGSLSHEEAEAIRQNRVSFRERV